MFAAYSGDVSALRRYNFLSFIANKNKTFYENGHEHQYDINLFHRIALSAVNMEFTDYDTRTALHVASAEGNKAFFGVFTILFKCLGSEMNTFI